MFHSKGKILLWLAALVTLLSLGLASKPLGLNARSISSEQTGGLMLDNDEGVGTIVIEKQTDPPGGSGFDFTDTISTPNSFSLGDGGTKKFINVVPDTYTVTEDDPTVTPSGFDLTGLTCVEDSTSNSTTDTVSRQATISLDAGETITCTFSNRQRDIIAVGGHIVPVNKLGLLAPWLGLAALASFAALTVVLVRRHKA